MNIKVPNGKSSTVVIVGGGTMSGDEKSNKMQEKRLDLLERKLDQQYKKTTNGYDPKDYVKSLDQIQKSFVRKLDGFVSQSRQNLSSQNNKLLEALKRTVSQKVKTIKVEANNNGELKTFVKKIDSLEDAIRKISLKTKNVTINKKVNLDSSFEKMFAKMEKAIRESKPRLSPSPS